MSYKTSHDVELNTLYRQEQDLHCCLPLYRLGDAESMVLWSKKLFSPLK